MHSVGELRFQVLGPVRLWRDGTEVDTGPRQQALLLTLLLTRVGRPVGTAELIDLMWGEQAPTSALNVIQKYVGALRRVLEPRLPAREDGAYLHRRGNGYLFTAGAGTLDLVSFREHVAAAGATREPDAALDHYLEALELWRGPAGGGTAAALDDEFYRACTEATALAVASDRIERVLPALQLAASMAPFHEPVQAALVTVLGAAGRQAEALARFRTVRERLADELGIDPGPALREAHLRVLAQPAAPAAGEKPAGPMSGLVGRVEEFAVLRRTVEGALAGRTAVGIVEGEPGAGKTRLLQEAAAVAARHDALVVWGRCLEGDGTPSMWPWEQALGRLVESLPAPAREKWLASEVGGILEPRDGGDRTVPDGNAQFRLFEQVVALVAQASAQRRVLLILDDLQWADVASLQLFHHLAGRLPRGTAMVAALRDRAPTLSPELSRVLATASRVPGHRRLRLGPLDVRDVAALVRNEVGQDPGDEITRAVHDRTAGNPFFVLELSRLLSEGGTLGAGVPNTIRDVVRSRMGGLDEQTRDLLEVAALIGRDVDLRLLARATGTGVGDCMDRLEPVQALGLLEPGPDDPSALRFAHDLVRESVSEATAKQRIVRLHLRVADALEQTHADDEVVAERLAYHLWAAGPLTEPARAAEALIRAGRCAANKLAFDSATRQLRHAVQVTRSSGLMDLELAALTLLAVVARRQAGFDASTVDLLERAEYLARSLDREAEAADFLFIRTMGAYTALEKDRGLLARRMHELGRTSPDPAVRRYARQTWGLHQWDVGNVGEAVRTLGESDSGDLPDAETPLRRDGSIPGEGPGWWAVTAALHGDVTAALALVDTWDTPGDPYAASVWVYYTTMIASMAGDAELARRAGDRWVSEDLDRLHAQIGHYVRQSRCWARALTGDDPAGAAAEAEELLAASLADPPQWGVAFHHALVAEMWLAAGHCDRADAALCRAGEAMREYGQRYAEGLCLLLKARLLQARGESVSVFRAAAEEASRRSTAGGALLFARRAEQFLHA
ncbi:ATP-binding protein [Actinoplanes italicus]|uniref:ATP-binding protein n=1 Tax=Actinoplanes italicus TaxID=113567 RepID=UPI001EF201E7|nr:AAA family ATPase [Actinoplanes italicus]